MAARSRNDLLHDVCSHLPESYAALLASLDPDDLNTHIEAYVIVRRLDVTLPEDLRNLLVGFIVASMDEQLRRDHPAKAVSPV